MMGELLKNAWAGWLRCSGNGKLAAVLLLTLTVAWIFRLGKERQREVLLYASVTAAACIFPVTAALIMTWQTKFYDYEWIWTIVPVTAVIACGGVLFLEWIGKGAWKRSQKVIAAVMLLCLVILCGRLGNPKWTVKDQAPERNRIASVLEEARGGLGGELCLWAPREVIEQARTIDPEFVLLYGRNMWQGHLNAYSYDLYDQDRRDLYVWMVMIGRYGTLDVPVATDIDIVGERLEAGSHLKGLDCMRKAIGLGVDRILLPGIMTEEALETLRTELLAETRKIGEYWLITIPEEGRVIGSR